MGAERGKEEKEGKEPGAVGWLRTRKAQVDLPDPHCPSSGPAEEGLIHFPSLPLSPPQVTF